MSDHVGCQIEIGICCVTESTGQSIGPVHSRWWIRWCLVVARCCVGLRKELCLVMDVVIDHRMELLLVSFHLG